MPDFPPCIHWEEPVFVSADVADLMYNVLLSGPDLSTLNITTNDTQYCPKITPCQEYTVTVTPISTTLNYMGSSNAITDTTIGGKCIHHQDRNAERCLFVLHSCR